MSVEKEELEALNEKFSNTPDKPDNWDRIYCAGLLFDTTKNSGSRLIMSSAFQEQCVILNNPEFPCWIYSILLQVHVFSVSPFILLPPLFSLPLSVSSR